MYTSSFVDENIHFSILISSNLLKTDIFCGFCVCCEGYDVQVENEEENKKKLPEHNKQERYEDDEWRELKNFKNHQKKVNVDQALNVTVDDVGRQKLSISLQNSEDTQSCQDKVEVTKYQIPNKKIGFSVFEDGETDRSNSLEKIQCRQSTRSNFDHFEDSLSIIVVDSLEKKDALSEEQNCYQQQVGQIWEHPGVKWQD